MENSFKFNMKIIYIFLLNILLLISCIKVVHHRYPKGTCKKLAEESILFRLANPQPSPEEKVGLPDGSFIGLDYYNCLKTYEEND
jgi:hypothetical protein